MISVFIGASRLKLPGSYWDGDYNIDEMLVSLVEETAVPGGFHGPTEGKWQPIYSVPL